MTSQANQYSALVASLILSVAYIIFLAAPRLDWYWWFGFVLFATPLVYILAGLTAYRWTTRPGRRYPAFDYQAAIAVRDRTRRGPDVAELRRAA